MPISGYFMKYNESNQSRTSSLKTNWELMKACLDYLDQNEEWLVAGKIERTILQEDRASVWEKELRMLEGKEKKKKSVEQIERERGLME